MTRVFDAPRELVFQAHTDPEVVPPERFVYPIEFEGMPGHILIDAVTFHERDGKTTVSSTSLLDSVEDWDGMLESGMESGAIESRDRLKELLERLKESKQQ